MNDVQLLWQEARPLVQEKVPFDLHRATTCVFRVGSHSHGTYIPPEDENGIDDIDLMVVVTPPPAFKLGLSSWEHSEFKAGRWDVVLYDWGKWLRMLRKSNPNVVGTLWLHEDDVFAPFSHPQYGHVRDFRHRILSKQMYPAFVGYAQSQLHKMTHHAHQGYMGEKRKRLVEKYGFDVKNAAHLIRLLRMACEAFETENLTVRRPDAAELIAIKQGQWSLSQVEAEAARLFQRASRALDLSRLRDAPDDALIESFIVRGYQSAWGAGAW